MANRMARRGWPRFFQSHQQTNAIAGMSVMFVPNHCTISIRVSTAPGSGLWKRTIIARSHAYP